MFVAMDEMKNQIFINESVPGKTYLCPVCGSKVFARRGDIRQHYFAHAAGEACSDSWDKEYDMSEWHRGWQERFPLCNREIVVELGGIMHRADILTGKTVIEFQHSPLSVKSFNQRNAFYHGLGYKVVWLFDLMEDYANGKIYQEEKGLLFHWKNPRKTFNGYDLTQGQVELFMQLEESGNQQIVKVKSATAGGFSQFEASDFYSDEGFMEYFCCHNGICPLPIREDITSDRMYQVFKKRYGIKLDKQQERAVEAVNGPVLLLAIPGSGKTTTLVARIGYMVNCKRIDPSKILALTYTKKAAQDMKERYEDYFGPNDDVTFQTINSLALELVRKYYKEFVKTIDNRSRWGILREIYKERFCDKYPLQSEIKSAEIAISQIKNKMLDKEAIKKMTIWDIPADIVYERYCEKLKPFIDFDDQLVLAYEILSNNEEALREIQHKYLYVCLDEAQDTSKLQYELIKLIVGKNCNIFMVGDEDQSIYRFRAADPKSLLGFKAEYPNPFILQLETNYRSTDEIIEVANTFISRNRDRYPKKMNGCDKHGKVPYYIAVNNSQEQYSDIVEKARSATEKTAFLYRENISSLPIVDQLIKEHIPFSIKKPDEILFFEEEVAKDIKSFMSLAMDDHDIKAAWNIYYKCGMYIYKKDMSGISGKVKYDGKSIYKAMEEWFSYGKRNEGGKAVEFRRKIEPMKNMKPADAIEHILNNGYGDYLNNKKNGQRHAEILKALARDDHSLEDFLKHLEQLERKFRDMGDDENKDANVVLSTVHSSKGLEYEKVYLVDVYNGVFPIIPPDNTEENERIEIIQEERRMLYVAMTRAKKELVFYRMMNSESCFLDELFPVNGCTIMTCIMNDIGNKVILKNNMSQKAYVIVPARQGLLSAKEIDLETGEEYEENCQNAVWSNRSSQCWERVAW